MNNDKLMENIINTPEKLPAILLPPSLLTTADAGLHAL